MNLPSDVFEEIIDSVTVVSRDEPRAADRRLPRVKINSHLSVAKWSDPSFPLSVRIRDLSAGGIGIFHNHRIGLDEQVLIRFPRQSEPTVLLLGTVVYWEPLAENLFGIGLQFERLVEEAEIAQQSEQTVRQQMKKNQIGVVARFTQAVARTWRVAS
jgi:hypothetical protein